MATRLTKSECRTEGGTNAWDLSARLKLQSTELKSGSVAVTATLDEIPTEVNQSRTT